uniref:Sxi1 n=1 Tax=Tremella mesenterica TaxID=5217 RepID=E2JKR9_TREME|nr:Sxi1 [Tremella mesenterica]
MARSDQELLEEVLSAYDDLHQSLLHPTSLSKHIWRWEELGDDLKRAAQIGSLGLRASQTAFYAASNVRSLIAPMLHLEEEVDSMVLSLSDDLSRLKGMGTKEVADSTVATLLIDSETIVKSAKLAKRRPPTSFSQPSPYKHPHHLSTAAQNHSSTSHRPPVTSRSTQSTQSPHPSRSPQNPLLFPPTDPIRTWFISHLASPYPTSLEKVELASSANITTNKLDSDLVNWRRRSGWANVRDKYCGGNKHRTKRLIEDVSSGKERRKEVLRDVEKVRAYLERREEERVGDWVKDFLWVDLINRMKEEVATHFFGEQRPVRLISFTFVEESSRISLSHSSKLLKTRTILSTSSVFHLKIQQADIQLIALPTAANTISTQDPIRLSHTPRTPSTSSTSSASNYINEISPSSRSISSSSSSSTSSFGSVSDTSSVSEASNLIPVNNKRPLPPSFQDESERPSVRVKKEHSEDHTMSEDFVMDSEYVESPVGYYAADGGYQREMPYPSNVTESTCGSLWSTEASLPMLPHMQSVVDGSASEASFKLPETHRFDFQWNESQ